MTVGELHELVFGSSGAAAAHPKDKEGENDEEHVADVEVDEVAMGADAPSGEASEQMSFMKLRCAVNATCASTAGGKPPDSGDMAADGEDGRARAATLSQNGLSQNGYGYI